LISFGFLSGCGINPASPSGTLLNAVGGQIHGGQSPIQGATVNLYVTPVAATGYGQTATLIGTAASDSGGNFTINNSATTANCPAGQQAYITSSGGFQSGQPTLLNTSVLMMAALGDCANVNANTHVVVNEVTTVAAAYALSGFMTTSAVGPLYVANVSAPPANNAATGGTTAAAGLPHAFLNAANLADYTVGSARYLTANITVGATTVNGSVPAAEINTLADILQSCINGATGNSSCTSLFSFTPSISGTAPVNTLQAMINLARNPYPSAAAMTAASGLFSLIAPSAAFLPNLTAQPPDWSLAVVYKNATAFPLQYFIAMDANDSVYAGASASPKPAGMSTYGTTIPAFTAGSTGSATRQIALDSLGNLWVPGYITAATTSNVYQYSTTTGGAPTLTIPVTNTASEVYSLAVDTASNLWVGNAAAVTPNIIEYKYTAGSYAANYTATVPGSFQPVALTIDANQNVWAAPYFTNGSLAVVLPNLTSPSAATYTTSGTVATPISATFASSAIKPLGLVVDASGNAWYGITGATAGPTATGIEEVIPSLTSGVITSLAPQPLVANATLGATATGMPGIDGSGVIYLADNSGGGGVGLHVYSSVAVTSSNTGGQVLSPPAGYLGCYLATAASTTCGTGSSSAVYNPRNVAIDSTGSVWTGITSGGFTQLIGLGAPSWPLLSTGKPGLSPGSSAVTPLP
jgi:hypothetical protein